MLARPRFLMCRPDGYEALRATHPLGGIRGKLNHKKALLQWTALKDLLLGELKAVVDLLEPVRGFPGLVFTAHGGIVKKRIFVRSNFRLRERTGEERFFETWLRKNNYIVRTVERPFCFEGEGDACFFGGAFYAGFRFPGDLEALEQASVFLKMPCFALELGHPDFHRFKTCFTGLSGESALVYPEAFETCARFILRENIPDQVRVPEKEARRLACDVLVVGRDVILSKGCPKTAKAVEKRGFRVHALDLSEFVKAGGGAGSLALRLE